MTSLALAAYSLGLAGYAAIKVLSPAFYALDDAKTPMMIALGSIVVNAVASYFFREWLSQFGVTPDTPHGYGHAGVALATSTVALVNFFALTLFMRKKIKRLNGREVLQSFARIAAASAIMSAVAFFTHYFLHRQIASRGLFYDAVEAIIPIVAGGITFVVAARLLGVAELEKLFSAIARKLGQGR
jgi:putative peptidoglycan lipid II flippase